MGWRNTEYIPGHYYYCGHCGGFYYIPKEWISPKGKSHHKPSKNGLAGICDKCVRFYDLSYGQVAKRQCEYCGTSYYANFDKAFSYGDARQNIRLDTCGKNECIKKLKLRMELPYKIKQLKLFKKEITNLRKAIKGA